MLSSESMVLATTGHIVNLLANDVNHFDEVLVEIGPTPLTHHFHTSRLAFTFIFILILILLFFLDYPGAALSVGGTCPSLGHHYSALVRSRSVLSSRFGSYCPHPALTDLVW